MRSPLVYLLLLAIPSSLAQNNLLNNGGFETGLMCYTNWMWSVTGIDFKGDYHFSTSTDSHSGTYSAQIACGGSDCLRAAIISGRIPSPANQSYLLNVYAKCPTNNPGRSDYVYVLAGPALNSETQVSFAPLTCDGTWHANQIPFQNIAADGYVAFYLVNGDTSWLLVDDVVLTYGDGTAPPHTVLHGGVRNVSISGQNVMVDGAPYLSLGFFDVGYGDLAQVAATGANTIVGFPYYSAADCFNTGTNYLDRAYDLGLNFVPDSSTTARLYQSSLLAPAAQTFAPHLANIGWFLSDEPDLVEVPWEYIPPSTFLAEYAAAKTQTSLPVTADFQRGAWGLPSYIAPYNGSVDIWTAEPYGTDFSTVNHAINLFNAVQPRPIWLIQDPIDASLIVPKAYWVVISGSTGIQYFHWDDFKADAGKLAAATQAFTELKGLNSAIFGHKMDTYVTPPSGIAAMSRFDPGTGTSYILSANSVAQNVQGNFTVQGLAAGQPVTVLYENRTITAGSGFFTDTFAGVSRHVYAIHSANTGLTATLTSKTGTDAARDWKFQVYDTGLGGANSTQITNVTFTQTGGTACTPTIAPGFFPLNLGTLAPSESASADVIANFTGCDSTAKFTVKIFLAANGGATSATVVRNNERK